MAAVGEHYEHTATGVLGEKRDTMLHNQLHLRNKLGRPTERGYINYPGEQFRYGVPNATRDGGAAEALSGWPNRGGLYFHRMKETVGEECLERDFVALNRSAVLKGISNSQHQTQFRATNDIRKKVQNNSENRAKTPRKTIPVNMVYGVATRPATPIDQLIQHRYQDKWLEEKRSADLAQRAKSETQRLKPGKVCDTRTSLLRVYQVPVEDAPLWHLPKFAKKAQPHLKTFSTDRAREAAFLAHSSDGIGRRGVCGQGIYEPAKM